MVDQMGLDLSLRTAMSGLRTVQKGLDTVSSNIANADTPGYTRKVLTQSTVVTRRARASVSRPAISSARSIRRFSGRR